MKKIVIKIRNFADGVHFSVHGPYDLLNQNNTKYNMEKKDFKRTLVTAALPYANGPVHIGHLAGVYVPADIYVRYKRLQGARRVAQCKMWSTVTTI